MNGKSYKTSNIAVAIATALAVSGAVAPAQVSAKSSTEAIIGTGADAIIGTGKGKHARNAIIGTGARSDERRVGKESHITCRSRWSRYH